MTRMTSAAAEASAIWSWMVASNSSSAGLRPAVSMSQNSAWLASSGDEVRRLYETLPTTLSRVVPASRATMAVRARVKRLNNELLPTLAWPMMATVGNLRDIITPIIPEA